MSVLSGKVGDCVKKHRIIFQRTLILINLLTTVAKPLTVKQSCQGFQAQHSWISAAANP
jgi:hypothetical protein